jgi:hypothetical protein
VAVRKETALPESERPGVLAGEGTSMTLTTEPTIATTSSGALLPLVTVPQGERKLSALGCGRTTTTYPKKNAPSSQFLTYDPRMTAAGAAAGGR